MTEPGRVSKIVLRIIESMFGIIFGAWAILEYIRLTRPDNFLGLEQLSSSLQLCLTTLMIVFTVLRWQHRTDENTVVAEPSPRWSGVSVIAFTGAAVLAMVHGWVDPRYTLIADAVVVGLTLLVASAVFRFATRNADKIGEARFRTTN